MRFTYERGGRLDNILIDAIQHARGWDEDAVFVFNDVNIIVTQRSNLAHVWSGYFGTPRGQTVGPCEIDLSVPPIFPSGYETWETWQINEALRIFGRLLAASR